jgi:hypothetical protein
VRRSSCCGALTGLPALSFPVVDFVKLVKT